MPAQTPGQYGLARLEGFSQVPQTQEKGIVVSCISVYIGYQRLQSPLPGMLGFYKRP